MYGLALLVQGQLLAHATAIFFSLSAGGAHFGLMMHLPTHRSRKDDPPSSSRVSSGPSKLVTEARH